jgi:Spy/CpxP family protein refolding chaperone
MNKIAALVLICGMNLVVASTAQPARAAGGGATASSRFAASTNPSTSPQASKASGDVDADTPENDDALHLTTDQKDKIKSIRQDAKDKVRDVQKDTTLTDDVKERKLKQIKKETRAQVWGVLTPDQQRQWAAELRERREAKHAGGKSPD